MILYFRQSGERDALYCDEMIDAVSIVNAALLALELGEV